MSNKILYGMFFLFLYANNLTGMQSDNLKIKPKMTFSENEYQTFCALQQCFRIIEKLGLKIKNLISWHPCCPDQGFYLRYHYGVPIFYTPWGRINTEHKVGMKDSEVFTKLVQKLETREYEEEKENGFGPDYIILKVENMTVPEPRCNKRIRYEVGYKTWKAMENCYNKRVKNHS